MVISNTAIRIQLVHQCLLVFEPALFPQRARHEGHQRSVLVLELEAQRLQSQLKQAFRG
jgi:hypothetical protein